MAEDDQSPAPETNGLPNDLETLQAMLEMSQAEGAPLNEEDLLTLGGSLPEDASAPEEAVGTYEDQPQPGSSEADEVPLSEDQSKELAQRFQEMIGFFRTSMSGVWELWDEIENAYNLRPDPGTYRTIEGEQIVSPLLMMLVDQAEARLEGGILEAEPLVRIRPIRGIAPSQMKLEDDSASAERFYNNYLDTNVRIGRRLVPALRRMPKLGTAVIRWDWEDRTSTRRFYTQGGTLQEEEIRESKLKFDLVPNEQIVIWPLDVVDWQEAEIVGHRAYYTQSAWKRKARELGLSDEEAKTIALGNLGNDPEKNAALDRQGVDADSLDAYTEPVTITELWCNICLPGKDEPDRFVVILHEESPKILRITWNTHHAEQHPYFPLRYKIIDGWAWGHGIGHEIRQNQAIASSLKTLGLDNLKAGAYWVNLVKLGSLAHQLTDQIGPGEKIPVEQVEGPDRDFKSEKLGGDAPEVGEAEAANDYEARAAVGLPDVLQGMGDARLKSGASTGQTLALIEQASVKFNSTGRTVKDDLGDFLRAGFQLLAQYAPDGVITRYADERDELVVRSLRWTPPRGRSIAEAFEIWVEAPSMATSNESRKERGLMLANFMQQQVQLLQPLAMELLSQENPAAVTRYIRMVYEFFQELSKRMIRYHDLPGMEQRFPVLPDEMPPDQVINQLQQSVQELQQQAQMLGEENEVLKSNIAQGLHHETDQPQGEPS